MKKRLTFEEFKAIYLKRTHELYTAVTPEDVTDMELEMAYDDYLDGEDLDDILSNNIEQE